MITRIAAVQRELRSLDIPAVLITNLTDVRYLSGFTGTTAYMLVDIEKAVFFTDSRYSIQAAEEVSENIIVEIVSDYSRICFLENCCK